MLGWLLGRRVLDPVPLVLYSRRGSAAALDVRDEIERARLAWPYSLTEIDVTRDAELLAQFGERLPVLWIGGQKAFEGRVNAADFTRRFEELAQRWWRARSLARDMAASRETLG
jgi:hypothetical protein